MPLLAYTCRDYKTRETLSVVVCMYIVHTLCLNIGCLAFVRDSSSLFLLPTVLGFKKSLSGICLNYSNNLASFLQVIKTTVFMKPTMFTFLAIVFNHRYLCTDGSIDSLIFFNFVNKSSRHKI